MHHYTVAALFLVGTYIAFRLLSAALAARHHARREKALGCQPVPDVTQYPGGIEQRIRLLRADRRGEVPLEIVAMYREAAHATFKHTFLGRTTINTTDPKNVQALLATQFHDFEIGWQRRAQFFPLLGDGIFTGDGELW